jgi:hypothetical protein
MRRNLLIVAALFLATPFVQAQKSSKKPTPIILDTDIGPDYDDVGAMAILHAMADKGEAKPLAVIASNKNELVVPTIDLINTYFGRPKLPTGAPKGKGASEAATQKWPELLVKKYPHTIQSTSESPDAVETYRKLLAKQPDKSVTIVTVGFLTNLANLLESGPDQFSKLSGEELVKKKVSKLVSMAGFFPKGREYNVLIDSVASEKVFNNWPTDIIFSGFEIGSKIFTGLRVINNDQIKGPVKNGRMSWDQTAVLVGVRGVDPYFGLQRGRIIVKGGNNEWKDDSNGTHYYLTWKMPVAEVTTLIEDLMMYQPKGK